MASMRKHANREKPEKGPDHVPYCTRKGFKPNPHFPKLAILHETQQGWRERQGITGETHMLTYKFRIQDGGNSLRRRLRKIAHEVNLIWNECNRIEEARAKKFRESMKAERLAHGIADDAEVPEPLNTEIFKKHYVHSLSAFDLSKLFKGRSNAIFKEKGFRIAQSTISLVVHQYATDRDETRKRLKKEGKPSAFRFPRWRNSVEQVEAWKKGEDELLKKREPCTAWIPFAGVRDVKLEPGRVTYQGKPYKLRGWREPPGRLCRGSFVQDNLGNWFITLTYETADSKLPATGEAVGVDLGLRTLATLSNGTKIENPKFYREIEEDLGNAQRERKRHSKKAKRIARKAANRRKNYLHHAANRLAAEHGTLFVGDVSAKAVQQKERLGKSTNDAAMSMFRNMLAYKTKRHGGVFRIVPEAYTTQTCSACGERSDEKITLDVKVWKCPSCGTVHDRDVNAARNILNRGLGMIHEEKERQTA